MMAPEDDALTADEDAARVLRLIAEGDEAGLEQHGRERNEREREWDRLGEGRVGV